MCKYLLLLISLSCTKSVEPPVLMHETTSAIPQAASSLSLESIVIKGHQLPFFKNKSTIVGFRYNEGWVQIPIQVDEIAMLDIHKPYNNPETGYAVPFYTDASLYTGADPNTEFDSDDELVFMLKDAGVQHLGADAPTGTISNTKKEVTVDGSYVYLFESDGSLQQSAGVSYVTYVYTPASPFNYGAVINNENSFVTTNKYKWHFSAEWISDQLILGGQDILDRHKAFFADGNCVRSENTFSNAHNAFVCHKNGPIRAIRSVMGANSGPYTQRTHLFYQSKFEIVTDLRVHEIPSSYDVFDYSSKAIGMKYTNDLNLSPKIIDGVGGKEGAIRGDIKWELVSGSLGSLVILHKRQTTYSSSEANFTSYYEDAKSRPSSTCTGDGQAIGTSGVGVIFTDSTVYTEPIRNTQTTQQHYTYPNFRKYQSVRTVYVESPNATNHQAQGYSNATPFLITVQ